MGETVRRHITVHGEVQGVYFRDGTQDAAERAGVSGWVRNRDDGTVEMVVEGSQEAVDQMLDFCREGTEQARVEDLDVREEDPEGLKGFEKKD